MTQIRERLRHSIRALRERGDVAEAERLEMLLADEHEAERLALTGDGAPRSKASERKREAV